MIYVVRIESPDLQILLSVSHFRFLYSNAECILSILPSLHSPTPMNPQTPQSNRQVINYAPPPPLPNPVLLYKRIQGDRIVARPWKVDLGGIKLPCCLSRSSLVPNRAR